MSRGSAARQCQAHNIVLPQARLSLQRGVQCHGCFHRRVQWLSLGQNEVLLKLMHFYIHHKLFFFAGGNVHACHPVSG